MDDAVRIAGEAGLPYTGLRGFSLDRRLLRYVPLTVAIAERVVPLTIVGDTLKLASATPHPDLTPIRRRFPYLAVDIVVAPAREIDGVLRRAQQGPS